jgi:hypothetical protein
MHIKDRAQRDRLGAAGLSAKRCKEIAKAAVEARWAKRKTSKNKH